MRISDWSSDVSSSDLRDARAAAGPRRRNDRPRCDRKRGRIVLRPRGRPAPERGPRPPFSVPAAKGRAESIVKKPQDRPRAPENAPRPPPLLTVEPAPAAREHQEYADHPGGAGHQIGRAHV